MEPRKDAINNIELYNLQKTFLEYAWGPALSDTQSSIDIMQMGTEEVFSNIYPIVKNKNIGVYMVFYDTIISRGKRVALGNEDLYEKLLKFADVALQSVPFVFEIYELEEETVIEQEDGSEKINIAENPVLTVDNMYYAATLGDTLSDFIQTIEPKDSRYKSRRDVKIYIRLYPQNVVMSYPQRLLQTQILSNNEILQTSSLKSNLRINLVNNIALNTVDTQWLDMYHTFFEYWLDKGNNKFQLLVGDYTLNNCYIETPPLLKNSMGPMSTFNLNIVSSITEGDEIR